MLLPAPRAVLTTTTHHHQVYQRQLSKSDLADATMQGVSGVSRLSHDELKQLFQLDLGAVCSTRKLLASGKAVGSVTWLEPQQGEAAAANGGSDQLPPALAAAVRTGVVTAANREQPPGAAAAAAAEAGEQEDGGAAAAAAAGPSAVAGSSAVAATGGGGGASIGRLNDVDALELEDYD